MRYLWALGFLSLALPVWAGADRADYDLDDNGLIEINDWADLDAIRHALDGKSLYGSSAGCPEAGCRGFELMASLEFDSNADGKIDKQDALWNNGRGWVPIGSVDQPFSAELDGNGHQIRNLWVNGFTQGDNQGLFGVAVKARFSRLALTGPLLWVDGYYSTGALAGWIKDSKVVAVFSTGRIDSDYSDIGGLVGKAENSVIQASFSSARTWGLVRVGGLVGGSFGSLVEGSLATGRSSPSFASSFVQGGLVGGGNAQQSSLRTNHWAVDVTGQNLSFDPSSQGALLAELRCPRSADSSGCVPGKTLYPGWSEFQDVSGQAYWQFGDGQQLPGLLLNGRLYRDSDGDGWLDDEDAFPRVYGASLDADKDGAPDSWFLCDSDCVRQSGLQPDQFPKSPAASLDADLDGLPDAWNPGCDSSCQAASGLTLDPHLNDRDNDGVPDAQDTDDNNDGLPDADSDSNGLIEIHSWAQLNAVRYEPEGRGRRLEYGISLAGLDSSGCPGRVYNGKWVAECVGYELMVDLDFDTNADGKIDASDQFWNDGQGWLPLGASNQEFVAVFDGNGHIIRNLMIKRDDWAQGLFGRVVGAQIRELGLAGPLTSIQGSSTVGGLVASLVNSKIQACFVTGGEVMADTSRVGGLVGSMIQQSSIEASYASTRISGQASTGGLVGEVSYSRLNAVYSSSLLLRGEEVLGQNLTGASIENSYWAQDIGPLKFGLELGTGVNRSQLKCAMQASDQGCVPGVTLFKDWDQWRDGLGRAYWDFGDNQQQLPALRLNGKVYRDTDADGLFDDEDLDDDNDGVPDTQDAFPGWPEVAADADQDGLADEWLAACDPACQQRTGLLLDWALDVDKDGVAERPTPGCDAQCQQAYGLSPDKLDKFPTNRAAFADSDGDGAPDSWAPGCDLACQQGSGLVLDKFPLTTAAREDSDGDGAPDSWASGCDLACQQASGLVLDKFLNNRAAFADSDNDGAPDSWTSGCDLACQQASGLVLDGFPNDASVSLDANGNGVPDRWNFGCDLPCQQAAGYSLDPQDKVNGFWRHSDGQNYLLQYQGSQRVNSYPLLSVGNDWQLMGSGDFNGDGASDLLWRHQTSGELYLFLFESGQVRQQLRLGQVADPDWKLVAIADVDGDKTSDIIWYHAKTAIGVSWLLKQGALSQELGLPQLTSLGWRLVGSGDLTGDGVEDLVWRHNETGDTWLFEMKQGQMQQALWLFSVPDQDWQLAAVADSNADGKADLIWRHGPSGWLYSMLMNGQQVAQQDFLLQLTDLNWQLVAAADLNADARADLFWRHAVTGQNYLFELNGLTPPEGRFMPEVADPAWQLRALLKP